MCRFCCVNPNVQVCRATHNNLLCTREAGHLGSHVACGVGKHKIERWNQDITWGLRIETPWIMYWGARAIYYEKTFDFELLADRQCSKGNDIEEFSNLLAWVNNYALFEARRRLEYLLLTADSGEIIAISGKANTYHLMASPKRSYGYLYIGAWVDEDR